MAAIYNIQSNLNRGELDPRLVGRIDIQPYYSGLFEATNVLTIPQGGVKKRPGMGYLASVPTTGRLEQFSFSTEQNYLLAFTDLRMYIFKDGVLQTNINGSGNDYATTPWSGSEVADFDFLQSADTGIVVHPDVAPQTIVRTSDTTWTISAISFTDVPQYDFNDASSPTPVSEIQEMVFTDVTEGDRYKLSLNGIITDDIVYSAVGTGGATSNENAIRDALIALPITASSGITVSQTSQAPDTYDITFSGSSADDWDLVTGTPVLIAKSTFAVTTTETQAGTTQKEDAWSVTRGWPVTATFHEARLYFGGSKSRPNTVWASRVNEFFNFDAGIARDDESIDVTLDTDQVNAIQAIYSNRALQVFTTGAEFYAPQSIGQPLTPENITISPQTNLGSKRVRPVTIDGVTLFLQKSGKSLNQYVFLNYLQANETRSISVLAPQLINDPVKLAASRGTEVDDANYVYIVGSDGNLTVFNTLITEEVSAFTNWKTQGDIKSAAVVDNKLYTLTARTINSVVEYHIEEEDTALNMDAAVTGTLSSNTISGLDHLEGETVKVKIAGAVQLDEVVSGGQITVGTDSGDYEVGLDFNPTIVTMPLNVPIQKGPNWARKKKISRVGVQTYLSNGVIVNGQRIADKTIGLNQFDAPEPSTELNRIHILGWDLQAQITITQNTPMPWQILSIAMEVAI
jgi:hypothetical protein